MKTDIHPKYQPVVFQDISSKEYPLVKVEISSHSHPFFTGKQKVVDAGGRVDKFRKRYAK